MKRGCLKNKSQPENRMPDNKWRSLNTSTLVGHVSSEAERVAGRQIYFSLATTTLSGRSLLRKEHAVDYRKAPLRTRALGLRKRETVGVVGSPEYSYFHDSEEWVQTIPQIVTSQIIQSG